MAGKYIFAVRGLSGRSIKDSNEKTSKYEEGLPKQPRERDYADYDPFFAASEYTVRSIFWKRAFFRFGLDHSGRD